MKSIIYDLILTFTESIPAWRAAVFINFSPMWITLYMWLQCDRKGLIRNTVHQRLILHVRTCIRSYRCTHIPTVKCKNTARRRWQDKSLFANSCFRRLDGFALSQCCYDSYNDQSCNYFVLPTRLNENYVGAISNLSSSVQLARLTWRGAQNSCHHANSSHFVVKSPNNFPGIWNAYHI